MDYFVERLQRIANELEQLRLSAQARDIEPKRQDILREALLELNSRVAEFIRLSTDETKND